MLTFRLEKLYGRKIGLFSEDVQLQQNSRVTSLSLIQVYLQMKTEIGKFKRKNSGPCSQEKRLKIGLVLKIFRKKRLV